jgi:hypothetical protein
MSKFLVDAFKYEQVGGISYAVSANTTNVNEGQTVQFDIITTGVPSGNTLYWTIEYISGNASTNTVCATAGEGGTAVVQIPFGTKITSVDFASYGTPNGSCGAFTLSGCHATNSISVVESFILNQEGAQRIGIVAGPGTGFGDPCPGTVKRLYIQATATNVDFVQGLSGSFTLPTNQVQITVKADKLTEGTESIQLYLRDGNVAGTVLANSPTVTIADTSLDPTFSITAPNSVNEGGTITYTINTTNIEDGTILYWYITGVSGADFTNTALSGTTTITSNTATVVKTVTNDSSIGEGDEVALFSLQYPNGVVRATKSTTIFDTSALSPAARATGGAFTLNPGDGWRYHIFRSSATLTVTTAGVLDWWCLGGGGGGGGSTPTTGAGGGGGGTGFGEGAEEYYRDSPWPVGIGGGGAGGPAAQGANGALSRLGPNPTVWDHHGGMGGGGGRGTAPAGSALMDGRSPTNGGGSGGGAAGVSGTVPNGGTYWGGNAGANLIWTAGNGGSNTNGSHRIGAGGGGIGAGADVNHPQDPAWTGYAGPGSDGYPHPSFPGPAVFPAFNPLGVIPAGIGQPIFNSNSTTFGGGGGGAGTPPNGLQDAGNGGAGGGGGGGSAGEAAPKPGIAGRANSGSGGGGNPGTGFAGGSGIVMFRYSLLR